MEYAKNPLKSRQRQRFTMETIFMNDVGSALNVAIRRDCSHQLMVDMGFNNRKGINLTKNKPYVTDAFLLSHYHYDHYNGIGKYELPFELKDVYFPKMPQIFEPNHSFDLGPRLLSYIFSLYIYQKGELLVDYIFRLLQHCSIGDIDIHFIAQGDKFSYGKRKYDVLWPPQQIKEDKIIKCVKNAIEAFDNLKREYPIFSELERIGGNLTSSIMDGEYTQRIGKAYSKEERYDCCDYIERQAYHLKYELHSVFINKMVTEKPDKKLIEDVNDKLRKAANHLSIAFRQEDNILFLGDLEMSELDEVCNELKKQENTRYDVIISPHHGTHWHSSMGHLECDYVLISIGNDLTKSIKLTDLSSISKCVLRTDCYGPIQLNKTHILN